MSEKNKQLPKDAEQQEASEGASKPAGDSTTNIGIDLAKVHADRITSIDKKMQKFISASSVAEKFIQNSNYTKMLLSMTVANPIVKSMQNPSYVQMLKSMVSTSETLKLSLGVYARNLGYTKALESMAATNAMVKALQDQQTQFSNIRKITMSFLFKILRLLMSKKQ